MGPIATTLKHLMAAGVTGDALVQAIAEVEAAAVVQPSTKPARSRAAERTAKWRAKKSEDGGGRASGDKSDACDVTERHGDVTGDGANKFSPQTPLSKITTLNSGADEREAAQRALRNQSQEIFAEVKKRVNGSADWTNPAMHRVDMFIQLMAPMKGDPCDFELDICPAIEAAAAKLHADGGRLTSWNYVRPIAIENRDRRLAGIPNPENNHGRHERPSTNGGRPAYRGRGPSTDLIGEALAHLVGGSVDPDIIEHTGPVHARVVA